MIKRTKTVIKKVFDIGDWWYQIPGEVILRQFDVDEDKDIQKGTYFSTKRAYWDRILYFLMGLVFGGIIGGIAGYYS